MSPTSGGSPIDPAELAISLAQVRADHTILQREVATNIQNLTSSTTALQTDVRHLSDQLADVARLQQQQVTHSEGLDRAFKSIEKLANSFDNWRERHEGENRTVADCVTEARGAVRGTRWVFGVMFGVVTVVGGYWIQDRMADIQQRFADGKAERVRIEAQLSATQAADVARLESEINELRAKTEQLEATRGAR